MDIDPRQKKMMDLISEVIDAVMEHDGLADLLKEVAEKASEYGFYPDSYEWCDLETRVEEILKGE